MWGSQSWLQPPFQAAFSGMRQSSFDARKRRLKAGGSQDWLPHSQVL